MWGKENRLVSGSAEKLVMVYGDTNETTPSKSVCG